MSKKKSSSNPRHLRDEDLLFITNFKADDYIQVQPQTPILRPDKKLLARCPKLDGSDFFAPRADTDSAHRDKEQDAFDTALAACPENKRRKYTAPPITDLP
ncbi:hypothetical protein EC968_003989 [Mortierella alpina]|nr:hypothetical protein EC968_003989 [Mortierella alpina]